MNKRTIATVEAIKAQLRNEPSEALEALAHFAAQCAAAQLGEDEIYCLFEAVQIGTTRLLAQRAIPLCERLARVQPRRLHIRHLALLNELAGNTDEALRIYRWIAASSVPANDSLSRQEISNVLRPESALHPLEPESAERTQDQDVVAHVDLAHAYYEMGLTEDAAQQVDRALALDPTSAEASDLRRKLKKGTRT